MKRNHVQYPWTYLIFPDMLRSTTSKKQFLNLAFLSSGDFNEIKIPSRSFSDRILRKDGSKFWASISWRAILDEDGQSLGIRTSTRDISQSKQIQKNFKRLTEGDLTGTKCWNLYRDDKTQCISCPLHKGIKIGVTDVYETSGVLGGKIFQVSHTGMIFQGKKAMLEIFQDITEKREMNYAELYNI